MAFLDEYTKKYAKKIIESYDVGFDLYNHLDFLAYRGSIAHGTFITDHIDDIDLIGYVIPPLSWSIGINSFGHHDNGTIEIQDGDFDIVIYTFKKYISLLMKQNPNILSTLFVDPSHILISGPSYWDVYAHKYDLISEEARKHFIGYAVAQQKKMESCRTYYGYMGEKRKALTDKYGYDVKNSHHAIRILRMGIELISTGLMDVLRKDDREELLAIKQGAWSLGEVRDEIDRLKQELNNLVSFNGIRDSPDKNIANKLLIHHSLSTKM